MCFSLGLLIGVLVMGFGLVLGLDGLSVCFEC